MNTTYTMLLLVLLISLTGCEEKTSNKNPMQVENTTEIFTQTDLNIQKNKQSHNTKKISKDKKSTTQNKHSTGTFILSSAKNVTHRLSLSKKALSIDDKDTPLVLLNICSEASSACMAQLSSFSKLQKKHRKNLFIVSVWVKNKEVHKTDIVSQQKKANYFVSSDTNNHAFVSEVFGSLQIDKNTQSPLSIIYKNGSYYSHFEGAVPIEMITHDIQQAIQK